MSVDEERCSRLVGISKYERNAPEIRQWWDRLFETLEREASIPPEKKLEILRDILPDKLLERILSKLELVPTSPAQKEPEQDQIISTPPPVEGKSCSSRSDIVPTLDLIDPPSQYHVIPMKQLAIHEPTVKTDVVTRRRVGQNNPYLKFFKKRPEKAKIWRTPPPLSLEEMNLSQKAEKIAEMIATDFVQWMTTIGGQQDLTVATVVEMFQIGFNTHAAHSLSVKMMETPSLAPSIADAMGMPKLARRACLHRFIRSDIRAAKKKPITVAFGSSLPQEMQVRPTKDDIAKKWLQCDKVPQKLETMAAVWEGITHLRSTREFCEYLLEHPLEKPPKYLKASHMLSSEYLRRPHRSIESEASGASGGDITLRMSENKMEDMKKE